jgi:TRAP-type transport system small permease protein
MSAAERTAAIRPVLKLTSLLAKVVFSLSRWLSILSMTATALMMFVIAADVFMRRVFNSPIFGAYDVIKVFLVITVFCAVAYVMMVKEHVIVDSLTRLYPGKIKRIVNAVVQLLNLAILAVIAWQSFSYALSMWRVGENLVLLKIPISPFIFVVAFGYAIFFLVVLVQFIFTLAGVDETTGTAQSPGGVTNGQH